MKGSATAGSPEVSGGQQANVDADIFDLVKKDLSTELLILLGGEFDKRNRLGWAVHGKPLIAHDGRNSLRDALDEMLDLTVYLRKAMVEQDKRDWIERLYLRAIQAAAVLKARMCAMQAPASGGPA